MPTPFDLTDRVALITGGGRGIGREIARVLAGAGAHIVIADLDAATAADAAQEIESLGRRSVSIATDVADRASVDAMVAGALDAFGHIDILVNNAAIGAANRPFLEADPGIWLHALEVNLNGVVWCSRAVGAHMVERGAGSIVNIASISGLVVNRPQPQADYNASKAAVIHLTRSLASEWAEHGVRVNSVSPGYIGTEMTKKGMAIAGWGETWLDMTPMKRMGTPTEVAYAVWFLASDAASYSTGSNVVVDGGYTIW